MSIVRRLLEAGDVDLRSILGDELQRSASALVGCRGAATREIPSGQELLLPTASTMLASHERRRSRAWRHLLPSWRLLLVVLLLLVGHVAIVLGHFVGSTPLCCICFRRRGSGLAVE